MDTDLTHTNERFSVLSESSEFLNLILNNISSCIMLLDKDLMLRAYNDPLLSIFSNKKGENLLYRKCGEVIGCAYQIEEQKLCGNTSMCRTCELRISVLKSYANNEAIFNSKVTKPFFNFEGEKIDKHLQFSTRMFVYKKEKYIILILEDITDLVNIKEKVTKLLSDHH
ncbi:hypothetical protein BZG02_14630 [Labilibaculum filiforme]|uniref:PAS domain-containing protein n=1 Tax=Labilibaculum filiforme TaxID=1940526 RepID=A0A2N3HUZ3_9BACT|nr:hypothetical protein [Labilibaculum filiforme]PKQ61858.1 hypothetical protein BZG02_14630 [Labilibaculum filiforme]